MKRFYALFFLCIALATTFAAIDVRVGGEKGIWFYLSMACFVLIFVIGIIAVRVEGEAS